MSRGKSYDHKKQGHPGAFPKNDDVAGKEHSRQVEQLEDIATYEAFKNRVKDDQTT